MGAVFIRALCARGYLLVFVVSLAFFMTVGDGAAAGVPQCASAWRVDTVYAKGTLVSSNGVNFRAAWMSEGASPLTDSGGAGSGEAWIFAGACKSGVKSPSARTVSNSNSVLSIKRAPASVPESNMSSDEEIDAKPNRNTGPEISTSPAKDDTSAMIENKYILTH